MPFSSLYFEHIIHSKTDFLYLHLSIEEDFTSELSTNQLVLP